MTPMVPPMADQGHPVMQMVWMKSNAKARALVVLLVIASQADMQGRTGMLKNKDVAPLARVAPHEVERLVNKLVQLRQLKIIDTARGARSYQVTAGEA